MSDVPSKADVDLLQERFAHLRATATAPSQVDDPRVREQVDHLTKQAVAKAHVIRTVVLADLLRVVSDGS